MLVGFLLFAAIILLSYKFYKWATKNNDYFEHRKIKHMKPKLLFGNAAGLFSQKYTAAEHSQRIYNEFPEESIYGLFDFREPMYIVRDPELMKTFGVKDFEHFEDHPNFIDEKVDELWGNTLIFMRGEKWRSMRATLSPAFTGSKMRQMFELVAECGNDVVKHFLQKVDKGERVNVEMKDLFSRTTSNIIASCAYGLKVNSFSEPENEFYTNGKKLIDFGSFKSFMKLIFISKLPAIAAALNITFADRKIAKEFRETIFDTMDARKKNNIFRPDMLEIMMQLRQGTQVKYQEEKIEQEGFATVSESDVGKVDIHRKWNDSEILSQCFVFFLAGFETTSTALMFCAYELAVDLEIQQKLHDEIVQVNGNLNGRRISYEALQKMKYLDQVVCETLRKWPPLLDMDRTCTKNYMFDDGTLKFIIEEGKLVTLPIYGIHHDEKYFPEPERFNPERFSDENKNNIRPGTYIPFGVGPRNCIGSRFALMQIKTILYYILLNFSLEPCEKTQIPIKLKKTPFALVPEGGIHLELKPRNK